MLALVTCRAALGYDVDLPLLQRELPESVVVCWDDRDVEWAAFDVVVVRSTWDYHTRRDDFLRWARHVSDVSALWNPLEVIEWNTDKRYLADFERRGAAIVPTAFVDDIDQLADIALDGDVVIKPSVGAGSNGVARTRGDVGAARRHVGALLATGHTVMVQPYVTAVDEIGETGLVYLGGAFSHAFRKAAILSGPIEFEAGLMAAESTAPHCATAAERALGDRVVGALPPTAYARIDVLPAADGPQLLEVELTEPGLFLQHDDDAPARAAAVFRSLAG